MTSRAELPAIYVASVLRPRRDATSLASQHNLLLIFPHFTTTAVRLRRLLSTPALLLPQQIVRWMGDTAIVGPRRLLCFYMLCSPHID